MEKNRIVYIDQNIIQYIYEGKLELELDEEIIWAYSDEHFNEINRHKDENKCFKVLEDLKAQKVRIKLDNQFKLTNTIILLDYENPKILYEKYFENIVDYKDIVEQFVPLQAFYSGNKDSLDIENYVKNYKSNLLKLVSNEMEYVGNEELNKMLLDSLDNFAEGYKDSLIDSKKYITTLDKARKSISKKQLSDLKPQDGLIINQIWLLVKDYFEKISVTKDQLFGKHKLLLDNGLTDTTQSIFEGIAQSHAILNYLGYWPDEKLTRLSKIYGINSDASHIAHGFFCNAIVSADDRLCKKASAIYSYFGKVGGVYQVEPNLT